MTKEAMMALEKHMEGTYEWSIIKTSKVAENILEVVVEEYGPSGQYENEYPLYVANNKVYNDLEDIKI